MCALLSVSKSETDSYNEIYNVPDYFVLAILKMYPILGTVNVRNLTVLNGDDYWNFFSTFSDILVMIFGVFFFGFFFVIKYQVPFKHIYCNWYNTD